MSRDADGGTGTISLMRGLRAEGDSFARGCPGVADSRWRVRGVGGVVQPGGTGGPAVPPILVSSVGAVAGAPLPCLVRMLIGLFCQMIFTG